MAGEEENFDFDAMMKQRRQGLLLIPQLSAYLYNAEFPDTFSITFKKGDQRRDSDGWFWPSTHPTWPLRALWLYLNEPESVPTEHREYMNTLALTMGTAIHGFIETCLRDLGLRTPALNACTSCPPERGCTEPGFADHGVGSRGHMDGILDLTPLKPLPTQVPDVVGFEFKCLDPDVLLTDSSGRQVRAGDVREGDEVVGWDESAEALVSSRVVKAWDNGVVPVWHIRTREGREIGVTDEHPFLTPRGWVMAKDLTPGDKVRVAFDSDSWHRPIDIAEQIAEDEAWFLGLMVGDGGLTGSTARLSSADPAVVDSVRFFVEERGCRLNHEAGCDYRIAGHGQGRNSTNPVRSLLGRVGLMGHGSRDKFIPEAVWQAGPPAWREFLSGYFDADGTVVTTGSYPHLLWTSVNRALLADAQTMLSYLGVRSSLMQVTSRYKGQPHLSWRLLVRDARAVSRAQALLAPRSRKAPVLAGLAPASRDDGRWVRRTQQGWDTVAEVRQGEPGPTVAIEMEHGTHVTAGLVTHNTGSDRVINGLTDLDLETYKRRHPVYYAQNQEYMELSGRRMVVVLFMGLGWPWPMREIHVPYDPVWVSQTREKYAAAREATEMPPCCHSTKCLLASWCKVHKEPEKAFLMPRSTLTRPLGGRP